MFSLFSAADIRRARDNAKENLETLVKVTVAQLVMLRHHPSFPDAELAPEGDALNCVRVLTRVLPYLYEKDELHQWEETIFWAPRRKLTRKASLSANVLFDDTEAVTPEIQENSEKYEDTKPLAEEFIDVLIDLLFFEGFTLPAVPGSRKKQNYVIWQTGVGCNTPIGTTKECESNRSEVLRLLLTLISKGMYMSANMLPVVGVRAITYIATNPHKQKVLSVLCSLLNTTLKYNPASWSVPYGQAIFKDPKQILVTYCVELLLAILVYPVPESGPGDPQKNYYRHFLGRLHRPQDFQFIVDGMTRILNQPIAASTSYLPGSAGTVKCAEDMIMLFWEVTQCNKRFRSFIIDTNRSHDFVILMLFYAIEYKLDPAKQGVVKMCAFILQTLSVEKNFGFSLNKRFEAQETLPTGIRIQGFSGTYGDFLIQSIYTLITTSKEKLATVYPALLSVIANIAGYLQNLSAVTSSKLLQLFSSMSSPSFLLANDTNHELLETLLQSMNAIIEHQYAKNAHFVYAILRSRNGFLALGNFTLESAQEEIQRQEQRRKDEAGRESTDSLSRRGSNDTTTSNGRDGLGPRRSVSASHHAAPDESAFAIGENSDEEDESQVAATPQSDTMSRATSIASSHDLENVEAVPTQLRGMSEKARGKMPAGPSSFSRQNSINSISGLGGSGGGNGGYGFQPSAEWLDSWLPYLPLGTILAVIDQVAQLTAPHISAAGTDTRAVLRVIQETRIDGVDIQPLRTYGFIWTPLSLGWYESLLWSFVYVNEMQVSKGTPGVWNGTEIKLFKVQEAAPRGPSLRNPGGAVDAVGRNVVTRIGNMSLAASLRSGPVELVSQQVGTVRGGAGGEERPRAGGRASLGAGRRSESGVGHVRSSAM